MEISAKNTHNLTLTSRNYLNVTGVCEVESFDETNILLMIDNSYLSIEGEGLHILKLNIDSGDVTVQGIVYALVYSDNVSKKQGGIISKLFGRNV